MFKSFIYRNDLIAAGADLPSISLNWKVAVKNIFYTFLFTTLFSSCLVPLRSFDKKPKPKAPDYTIEANWSALPNKKDSADICILTAGICDNQATAQVDVFYVHPTTYPFGKKWNASLSDKKVNRKTDKLAVRNQASVFNGSCKVYAPRYRQAALYCYTKPASKKGNSDKAFDLAYSDVSTAFSYYLKNYNNGRPFIIASHSQGTDHAVRLIHEFFENNPELNKQLVAAYIIGRPIKKNEIKGLVPCDSANQTGCYITWNTVLWEETTFYGMEVNGLECVNPLTWKRDTCYATNNFNMGGLPQAFDHTDKGLVDGQISSNGLLWAHRPHTTKKEYPRTETSRYHVIDYNLYYMNIRENVKQRVEQYLRAGVKG